MIPRWPERATRRLAACALLLALLPASAGAVVFTGEVRAVEAQVLYTPQADMIPLNIRYYVADGQRVRKGDVLLRVDASQVANRIPDVELRLEAARARAEKDTAELRVKALDARVARVDADAALAVAKVDAAIPRDLVSALDYDRYQGELDHATREAALKQREHANANAAVERRSRDAALEVRKLELEHAYLQARLRSSELRADRDGVLVHGFNNNWLGGRIDEGSATMPGSRAGHVASGSQVDVVGWVLEPDRRGLKAGQAVSLAFDAFPGRIAKGRIRSIAGAPAERKEWGSGRYFTVEIALDRQGELPLLAGMSARIISGAATVPAVSRGRTQAGTLRIDGEVYARRTSTLPGPSIDRQWNFTITQLAPDGTPVKKGDIVLSFDTSQVVKTLSQKQSELEEKQRALEKLDLELQERARNERLAVAEATAQVEKARRKTGQPAELIAGIEYRKLVIARGQAEEKATLAALRQRLAAAQRHQERRLLLSEVAQLQADVARSQAAIASLQVRAARDGVMMHRSNWQREKFDVGSEVYRGQTVAEIPDVSALAVRAQLPEREFGRVAVGTRARIILEGSAGSSRTGKIASIGRAVRSKSQVQPIPVVDVEIALDAGSAALKPGQAVRVELEPRS